jgi:hypothetical protein
MDKHLRAFVELMRGKPPRKVSPFDTDSESDDESDQGGINWESRHDPSREWRAKVTLGDNETVGVGEIEVVDLTDDVQELTQQQYEAEISKRGLKEHKAKRNPDSSYIVLIKHLVWQLEIVFPEEYGRKKERYKDLWGSWYHVVYRWTQRNGLRVKKVNRENVQDRKRKAAEMLVLRREVQKYVRDNKVRPDQILNMDEVGLRAFCLVLKTLHWAADTRGTEQCSAQKRCRTLLTRVPRSPNCLCPCLCCGKQTEAVRWSLCGTVRKRWWGSAGQKSVVCGGMQLPRANIPPRKCTRKSCDTSAASASLSFTLTTWRLDMEGKLPSAGLPQSEVCVSGSPLVVQVFHQSFPNVILYFRISVALFKTTGPFNQVTVRKQTKSLSS